MPSKEGPNIAWNSELKNKKLSEGNEKSLFVYLWMKVNQSNHDKRRIPAFKAFSTLMKFTKTRAKELRGSATKEKFY